MEGGPPTRPLSPRAPESLPGEVTHDDLRALRRWVVVAGVWAVAATAIALIALLDNSDSAAEKRAGNAEGRVRAVERKLDRRIDALESRLEGLPRSEDVSNLAGRLTRAERSVARANQEAKEAGETAGELEDRVEQLEEQDPAAPPDDEQP